MAEIGGIKFDFPAIKEVLASAAGHQVSNLLSFILERGTEAEKQIVVQAGRLMAEGKFKEAEEALKALPGGIGRADEAIWWSDLAFLRRRNLLTPAQATALEAFLRNLTEAEKDKIRLTHVVKNEDQRRHDLVTLGRIDRDDAKRQHLDMVFHKTLADTLNAIGAQVSTWVRPKIEEAQWRNKRFDGPIWRLFRPITCIWEGLGF
ncbi:MAG: hypothetical protein HYV13_01820 [Candidatus Doudnabacteria bacterium]|nr:hypothetical protein [Candidatus Doudnabacteria bacterium]